MTDNQNRNDDQSRNRENEGQYGSSSTGKQDPAKNKEKEGKPSGGTAGYSSGTNTPPSQGGMNDKSSSGNA